MFVHGGDSALDKKENEKRKEKRKGREEEGLTKRSTALEGAVNNIQYTGTMATMWQVVSR